MHARAVRKRLAELGCQEVRQKGSHIRIECPCGKHHTTVPDHGNRDLLPKTLRGIERDLEPCLGTRWLRG